MKAILSSRTVQKQAAGPDLTHESQFMNLVEVRASRNVYYYFFNVFNIQLFFFNLFFFIYLFFGHTMQHVGS